MQASLNIDGIAFCTLDIEGAQMPPSPNLIENIMIFEGFGMGLPTMKLSLFDENETLSRDLNLQNGTQIKLRLGKSAAAAPEYAFSVFGWKRPNNAQGKVLHVVCILNKPKFSAGAFCEAFEGTSANAMQQVAELSGLLYEGPKTPTADTQYWINLNTTRISFTEDMAMRGFTNPQSCMCRVVRADGTLVYKDLMEVLKEEPEFKLCLNTEGTGGGSTISVRAAKDASTSGLFTHFINYGHKLFSHSFDGEDTAIESLDINATGAGVPVNAQILSEIKERGSRVSYSGFDFGTGPEDGYNYHENYEQAYYQNVRLLSLFSERVTAIADTVTEIKSLTSIDFEQGSNAKGSPAPNDVAGRYLVGGKTIVIKNGTKYAEAFYLYRPFITEEGNANGAKSSPQKVSASTSGVDQSSRNFTR